MFLDGIGLTDISESIICFVPTPAPVSAVRSSIEFTRKIGDIDIEFLTGDTVNYPKFGILGLFGLGSKSSSNPK